MTTAIQKRGGSELALTRRTVAKDCNEAEFDQFIHICKAVQLDPLRRQIYAFVFGKDKAADRRLVVVTGIDGYRAISDRSDNYRPDDKAPRFKYDETLKCATNPLGIVSAEVTLYKYSHGGWHPVVGEVYWDEYVPTKYPNDAFEYIDTGETWADGNPKRKKIPKKNAELIIDPTKSAWIKSPRNQIAKCAEAQAHRKGWPNDFSGLFVQEEIDREHTIDLTASEIVTRAEADVRMAQLGGPKLVVDWMDGGALGAVGAEHFHGAAMDFIRENQAEPSTIRVWQDRNRETLRQYWGMKPDEALDIKNEIETTLSKAPCDE